MFVFTKSEEFFVYVDIPIPIGTFIRKQIINDLYRVIKHYWFVLEEHLDLAHIPYSMRKEYINQEFEHMYITFSRDPYQKLISTFVNTKYSDEMTLKEFICNVLAKQTFDDYHYEFIHYYPQYKFVIDEDESIDPTLRIFKLEEYKNEFIKFTEKLVLPSYDLREYFDPEALEKFNEIYARDFEVFGYKKITDLFEYEHTPDIIVKPIVSVLVHNDEDDAIKPLPPIEEVKDEEEEEVKEEEPVAREELSDIPVSDSKINPLKQFVARK